MKMKGVHELLVPGVGLLLVLGIWSAALEAVLSAGDPFHFQLSDGDNVTCRPIGEQPSLQPNKTWNPYPSTKILDGNSTQDTQRAKRANQTFALEAGACPNGTYPDRTLPGSASGRSLDRRKFLVKRPGAEAALNNYPPHEHIATYLDANMTQTTGFKGTEVFINLWKPFVEGNQLFDQEFSLAQLWVTSGYYSGPMNTIEVGWQVYPVLYGDGLPRLFVYWTSDGYNETGCYNLRCSGFVQVSNKVLIAGSFTPISQQAGEQYEIQLRVFKDDDGTGDWWLQLNDENVGYWPKDIFNNLKDSSEAMFWGGEIVDEYDAYGGNHTHTQMGSGQYSREGFRRAAYQRNIQYIDQNKSLVDASLSSLANVDTQSSCYSFSRGQEFSDWGFYFFFGGKGYNRHCTRYRP